MKNKLQKKARSPLAAVFTTIFIDLLGVGILIPVMPLLVTPGEYRITPDYWSIKGGFILLGWLTAAYPIAQFLAAPILGQLSDRHGRKRVLAYSIFGTAVGYAISAYGILSKNIGLLFLGRIIDGLTGGNISVAQAAVSDVSTPANRAKNFGRVGMAFGLGFVIGPYIGGKLADPSVVSWFHTSTPFWFAMLLSLANTLFVLFKFPETHSKPSGEPMDWARSITNVRHAVTMPGVRAVMPTVFLFTGGFTFFTTFFGVILRQKFGFSQGNIGDYFAYVGICIATAQGLVVAVVSKKLKDYQVLRFAVAGTAVALALYAWVSNYHWLFAVAPLMAIFNGLSFANMPTIVSRVAPDGNRGEALGISSSVQALAQGILAAMSGYIASISQSKVVLTGAAVVLLGQIAFWVFFDPQRHRKTEHDHPEFAGSH